MPAISLLHLCVAVGELYSETGSRETANVEWTAAHNRRIATESHEVYAVFQVE